MSKAPPSAASAAAPARRRWLTKWPLAIGASALGLMAAAAIWATWPSPAPKPRKATAAPAVAQVVAPAASAAASADASEAPTRTPQAAAAPPPDARAAASSPAAADPSPRAEPALALLQRRLGQVLGKQGQLEAAQDGGLRLVMRSPALSTVAHQPAAVQPPAEARASARAAPPAEWGYTGRSGPQAWGRLKPEYRLCASGSRQSPIDIRNAVALDLEPLQFDYRAGGFTVVDTGRTVQIEVPPGQWLEANGRRYQLQQLQFHRPSEERVNGRRYDMGVHFVHRDAEGRVAVVALLLERGATQPVLQTLWRHLPLDPSDPVTVNAPLDIAQLLPADRRYYAYTGSLTAPPCTEGVLWLVLQQPVQASAEQIDAFARLYPMNSRPVQQAAGRLIKQSQ